MAGEGNQMFEKIWRNPKFLRSWYFFPFLLIKSQMLEGLRALEPVELYKYCSREPVTNAGEDRIQTKGPGEGVCG